MKSKPLRTVTRKCSTCQRKFRPGRRDAKYCSDACRQRSHRTRADIADIDRRIDEARRVYWRLIRQKAEALGVLEERIVTEQSVTVTPDGRAYRSGARIGQAIDYVGQAAHRPRPGWTTWGLESGGLPHDPPGSSSSGVLQKIRKAEEKQRG